MRFVFEEKNTFSLYFEYRGSSNDHGSLPLTMYNILKVLGDFRNKIKPRSDSVLRSDIIRLVIASDILNECT